MINYQADVCTDRFIISISGHAAAAPYGQDIVCAAASALALTMLEAVRNFDEHGDVEHFAHSVDKGSVEIDFTVKEWVLERAQTLVDAITGGFLLLEENYPEYVSVS